ncbi:MAG: glutathione S-transferase [Desulforhopalus sp.]|jgi:glutathione S-transferase
MKLILYYAPIACSLVPYITLTEAAAEFELRTINMSKAQNLEPEFLKYNPKHKVPVLVIDGEPLTENVAIQIWIARNFPDAKLLPTDSMDEYKAISIMAWCASGIHPTLTPNFKPQLYCDIPGSEESVRRCAQKLMVENFRVADDLLAGGDFFFDHFTAADAYFFWCFRRAQQFEVDVSTFKHCIAHFERLKARDSVQTALANEARILEKFSKLS